MTWRELLAEGEKTLQAAEIEGARHDARELLFAASGLTLTTYPLALNEEADEAATEQFQLWIARRAGQEPLQYILGRAPFYGREFAVREGVLIPRFDTETLVAAVLPEIKSGMHFLDLCTGSGCILLTLLLEGPEGLSGVGTDISGTACACAEENAERFSEAISRKNSTVSIRRGDLWANASGKYDIIISNPPYIKTGDIPKLDPEVRGHEPSGALDGGCDGLAFYRRILGNMSGHLAEDGLCAFETGYDQAENVRTLMEEAGFRGVRIIHDLAGRERVVSGRLR